MGFVAAVMKELMSNVQFNFFCDSSNQWLDVFRACHIIGMKTFDRLSSNAIIRFYSKERPTH